MGEVTPLLNQEAEVQSPTVKDLYGKSSFATAVTYPCRAEEKLKRRLNPRGEVITTTIKFTFDDSFELSTDQKITYDSKPYRPVFINRAVAEDGTLHHQSAECEIWRG